LPSAAPGSYAAWLSAIGHEPHMERIARGVCHQEASQAYGEEEASQAA